MACRGDLAVSGGCDGRSCRKSLLANEKGWHEGHPLGESVRAGSRADCVGGPGWFGRLAVPAGEQGERVRRRVIGKPCLETLQVFFEPSGEAGERRIVGKQHRHHIFHARSMSRIRRRIRRSRSTHGSIPDFGPARSAARQSTRRLSQLPARQGTPHFTYCRVANPVPELARGGGIAV